MACHCGLSQNFEQCCEPIITGEKLAETAEQLMRARYSAYVEANTDFLHDSLHPESRDDFDADSTEKWASSSSWIALKILGGKAGKRNDRAGTVEFTASYEDADGRKIDHSERSHFKKEDDQWFFCDGQAIAPNKVGRNDPCSCGSGKKYKKCCGA